MPDPSRRDFLKLARDVLLSLSGALALGGLFRFFDFDPNPAPRTEFDLGPAEDYPLNSADPALRSASHIDRTPIRDFQPSAWSARTWVARWSSRTTGLPVHVMVRASMWMAE